MAGLDPATAHKRWRVGGEMIFSPARGRMGWPAAHDVEEEDRMKVERLPPIVTSLKPSNHPYLNGAWTPLHEEVNATDLDVIEGKIPADIDGVYLRNTENQIHQPLGRFHPFDGDGMIHQIDFHGGRPRYRNRFVRTRCFAAEQEGRRLALGRAGRSGASGQAAGLRRAWLAEGFLQHRHRGACRQGALDLLSVRRRLSPRSRDARAASASSPGCRSTASPPIPRSTSAPAS